MISSILMQTIIATALPIITNDLGQKELYGWIFSSYMIASTITIPLFSNLSDIYGRKPFYLWGMLLFLIGSVLSGFSQSMVQLIIFRFIQGIGAGAIAPSAIAMISELFIPEKRVKMLGLLSAFQVFANIIGPLLGGIITDLYSWRWTFLINLPIGLIALLLITYNYNDISKNENKKYKEIDYIGSILLGMFLVLFILLFQMQGDSLINLNEIFILIMAIFVFIGFIKQEKKHVNPILSLDLIKIKNVKISLISMLFLGTILYGMITILPLYGQAFYGPNALEGGKILLIFSLGIGIGGILSGSISKYLNFLRLVSSSWIISIIGLILLTISNIYTINYYLNFIFIFIIGIGLGIKLPLFLASSQNAVGENKRAVSGGLIQISRNIGGAVGIPIFTNLVVSREYNGTVINNFTFTFILLAIIALIGLIVGLQFKKNEI